MLLKNVTKYIEKRLDERQQIEEMEELALFKEEQMYIEKHQLLPEEQMNFIAEEIRRHGFKERISNAAIKNPMHSLLKNQLPF